MDDEQNKQNAMTLLLNAEQLAIYNQVMAWVKEVVEEGQGVGGGLRVRLSCNFFYNVKAM